MGLNMNLDIAIVAMECKVPGANNLEKFWDMIVEGKEGICALSANTQSENIVDNNYVASGGFVEDIDLFDCEVFGISAREAAFMDPQHRQLLMLCSQVLEKSGNSSEFDNNIGVFTSIGFNSYFANHLANRDLSDENTQSILLGNVHDCVATRVAYNLNLTGPAMSVQCGCSSTLVGIHQARVALLAKQCDSALVGGASLIIPQKQGYNFVEGGVTSPDGHCRPLSNEANGTVFTSGVAVVLLKRLSDAQRDGDKIYAVIKGSAINNDGDDKASFTAPSVSGQKKVIQKALRVAKANPNSVKYVECHGTGTPIGDPIELSALASAIDLSLGNLCAVGTLKANVGHMDVVSGIGGLIKTSMMLDQKVMPVQINCITPCSQLKNSTSSFYVNNEVSKPWKLDNDGLSGVSSFGFGGTNAHVVLQGTPNLEMQSNNKIHPTISPMIPISAKTESRLSSWIKTLRNHIVEQLSVQSNLTLAQVAYTMQTGHPQLPVRVFLQPKSLIELVQLLERVSPEDYAHCKNVQIRSDIKTTETFELRKQWLAGAIIDFKAYYADVIINKVAIPAKPGIMQSCWISEQSEHIPNKDSHFIKNLDVGSWLYRAGWTQVNIIPDMTFVEAQPVMIVGCGKQADALVEYFRELSIQYQQVELGYFQTCKDSVLLDPLEPDISKLYDRLQISGNLPKSCVLFVPEYSDNTAPEHALQSIISFIIKLAQHGKLSRQLQQWTTIVQGVNDLFCEANQPYYASLIGICRSIGQELSHIRMQILDQPRLACDSSHIADLLSVILNSKANDLILLRDQRFWKAEYQSVELSKLATPVLDNGLERDGVYIVTGGLGDVASIYVDYLLTYWNAKIVLTGRSQLPPRSEWQSIVEEQDDNTLVKRLTRLKKWSSEEHQVKYCQGDVTNLEDMSAICRDVQQEFGKVSGIIHIAGVSSDLHYKPLADLSWKHCWKIFNPKITGLQVIEQLTDYFNIDHCLVVSSISSALTGLALGAYGASHNAVDAIVQQHSNWKLINWDAFNFHMGDSTESGNSFGSGINQISMTVEESSKALQIALQQPYSQRILVSTSDLPSRAKFWANRGYLNDNKNEIEVKNPRPQLRNNYIQANSQLEEQLVKLWESLLGVEPIGIHDNFFELGGHSLLTLELVSKLQRDFDYEGSVIDMFETATINKLATALTMKKNKNSDTLLSQIKRRAFKQKQALKRINKK